MLNSTVTTVTVHGEKQGPELISKHKLLSTSSKNARLTVNNIIIVPPAASVLHLCQTKTTLLQLPALL